MKTVEEFIKELDRSEALRSELEAIKDKDALAEFLKKNDCGATVEEFEAAMSELTDNDAEAVAGGGRQTPGHKRPTTKDFF